MSSTSVPPGGRVGRLLRRLPPGVRRRADHLPASVAPPVPRATPTPRIAILGAGFGGLGMAARLRMAGIETFTIHEKAATLGGTWRDNTYPGAACDVPSHLYSLSFAPKSDWTRRFPEQAEILAYLHEVADRFDLRPHLELDSEVAAATFDDERGTWHLEFVDGSTDEVDIVISATGQLNRPQVPDLPGLDDFPGTSFHSARWDHDHDLTDRDVAVVGIGASAIQFVPEIAKVARSVTLFQRSVNFVAPKPDGEFSAGTKRLFRWVPPVQRLYRFSIWLRFDLRWVLFRQRSRPAAALRRTFNRKLGELVSDALPTEALIPDYPVGCKRILISNDWYPTLLRPNVRVVTAPVDRVGAHAVVAGGESHPADTVVFGTGFQTTGFLAPMRITGRDGVDLHERWSEGAEAHLGITVAGFPNLFLLYGPNTNLGHNSIIFMLERQIGYILGCVRSMLSEGVAWIDVRPDVQAASNRRLTKELSKTVWAAGCHSWYKTAAGRITNTWSGPAVRYWLRTARPRPADFERRPHAAIGR